MIYHLSHLKNESGMALITGLVILVLLTAIGTYAINLTQIDQTLSANLKASKQAFYLADAGIEWGKQRVLTDANMPPSPAGSTQNLNSGSYTVAFKDILPQALAWQYRITVEATGNIGPDSVKASKTLQAFVTKTYDISDGAITMRGNEAHSQFEGDSFQVDGRDYYYNNQTGQWELTSSPPQVGISVPNTTLESVVEGALSSQQKDNVQGLGGTSSVPSVGVSTSLSSSAITAVANTLCSSAHSYTPILIDTQISGDKTYGTRTSPQITCFDGIGVPGLMGVEFSGNVSGAGILIVKHADLLTRGNLNFEGLVIVTGNKVGFGMWGGGEVYGSVIINETSTDGSSYRELWLKGNAEIKRSLSALSLAKGLIPLSTISGIISGLPTSIQQVSWTEVQK